MIAPSAQKLLLKHLQWYGRGGGSPYHYQLLEDPTDGLLFIDYLQAAFGNFPDAPVNYELLQAHRDTVIGRLEEYQDEASVRQKYEWIATYHNYACQSFADHHVIEASEWVDPEYGAKSDHAKKALDHLISFEGNQPPIRLDRERLRNRLDGV